jgi:hypothetical protein
VWVFYAAKILNPLMHVRGSRVTISWCLTQTPPVETKLHVQIGA